MPPPPPPSPPKPPPFRRHLLLITVAALILFSLLLHTTVSPSSPNPSPTFPPLHHHSPSLKFPLTIKLLTFTRLPSLARCLASLAAATYPDNPVIHLHVYLDHFVFDSGSVDDGLGVSRRILKYLDGFRWGFGEKVVHYRSVNVGLQAQWIESWWPNEEDGFVFVVEDDVEVSRLWYVVLREIVMRYYYGDDGERVREGVFGVSLQRARFVPGKHGNKINLDNDTRLFLYQLVGTWGQLLFPKPWKEFRLWYDEHKAKGIKPILDGMVTTGWYKKMGEKIWTPWFIKFIHSRGYYNIYTHFDNEGALSVSHRDAGVNYGRSAGPDSHLLDESSLDFNHLAMPPLSDLKLYDFCFREVVPRTVLTKIAQLAHILSYMQKEKPILLVSISETAEAVTRNLLCHFEGLNIQNYIFVGQRSNFLIDLARRGHPVVDVDNLFEDIRLHSSVKIQSSNVELFKEIMVMAYLVSKCLESGFDSWAVNGNMLVSSNYPTLDFVDPTYDFYISKASGFFFVRSTTSTMKVWDKNFLSRLAKTYQQLVKDDPGNFVSLVSKELDEQGAKYKSMDGSGSILQLDSASANKGSSGDMKTIFWSSDTGFEHIHKSLDELGLWIVDEEASCRAVVCHGS